MVTMDLFDIPVCIIFGEILFVKITILKCFSTMKSKVM